jgi:4-amino-4-deoxy-L-arabinose transferase-like glycosyltransferase
VNAGRLSRGLLLLIAAFGLRCGWVSYYWFRYGPALEFDDERLHWELASNLARDGVLVSNDGRYAARMPLYPLFLSLFAGAGVSGILAARLAQALLSAVLTFCVWRLAQTAAGPRAGLVAGAISCLDPFAIFFCNLLLTETVFSLLAVVLTGSAWKLLTASGDRRLAGTAGFAAAGAAAVLTRPTTLGWLILLWLSILMLCPNRRRAAAVLVTSVVLLVLAMLPWGLRNRRQIGACAWLSTNGGVTLYDGQGPQADGSSNQAFLAEMPELAGLNEVQRDRRLRELALAQIQADPQRVLRLAAVKFKRIWNPVPNVTTYRRAPIALASAVFTAATLLLAIAGLTRAFIFRSREYLAYQFLLWLPVVYFTLVHCIFVGSVRYRVPLMPILALAAGLTAAPRRAILATELSKEHSG